VGEPCTDGLLPVFAAVEGGLDLASRQGLFGAAVRRQDVLECGTCGGVFAGDGWRRLRGRVVGEVVLRVVP
jgi:hypothetical protein